MDSNAELEHCIDREKIRDCLARLARGEDRRDSALIGACYWPDAKVDYGIFLGSFAEYLAWVVPGAPSISTTLHTLGQSLIELKDGTATAETHLTSYHRIDMGGPERDIVIVGRYLDRLEKRERAWRIVHRTMLYDWMQDFGQSVDWSKGVMGTPFRTAHSVGRARDDHSETFFGG